MNDLNDKQDLSVIFAIAGVAFLIWWLRRRVVGPAGRVLAQHDLLDVDFEELVSAERAPYDQRQPLVREAGAEGGGIPPFRYRPARFEQLASALAWECYAQFGHRERSEANVLVSRRFMRDILAEHQDLRAKDKARLLDRALLLSFIPTSELSDMVEMSTEDVWRDRESIALVPSRGFFSWVFGRKALRRGAGSLVTAPGPIA